jgi:SulP family sulfate permease
VTCFVLTVVFDMVVAVMGGVVFAALLFMRRMAELTQVRLVTGAGSALPEGGLPRHVALYEMRGRCSSVPLRAACRSSRRWATTCGSSCST